MILLVRYTKICNSGHHITLPHFPHDFAYPIHKNLLLGTPHYTTPFSPWFCLSDTQKFVTRDTTLHYPIFPMILLVRYTKMLLRTPHYTTPFSPWFCLSNTQKFVTRDTTLHYHISPWFCLSYTQKFVTRDTTLHYPISPMILLVRYTKICYSGHHITLPHFPHDFACPIHKNLLLGTPHYDLLSFRYCTFLLFSYTLSFHIAR